MKLNFYLTELIRTIQLPVEKLLAQYHEPKISPGQDPSLVLSFSLMYVQMGVDKLSIEKQIELLPLLIKGISHATSKLASTQFSIILKVLSRWTPPERDSSDSALLREKFGFNSDPSSASFLSEKFTSLFLIDLSILDKEDAKPPFRSPGLSFAEFEFLTKNHKSTFGGNFALIEVKKTALKFILSGAFNDEEMYFPLLAASSDSNSVIVNLSETLFRKLSVNLENPVIIKSLYNLIIGDPSNSVLPAKPILKARVVNILSQSKLAANTNPYQIAVTSLSDGYIRLVQAGFRFIRWMVNESSNDVFQTHGKQLVDDSIEWIKKTGWPKIHSGDASKVLPVRSSAYEVVGAIIGRYPAMINDLRYVNFLFDSLEKDSAEMKPSVQEALSEILPAVELLSTDIKSRLKTMLLGYLTDPFSDDGSKYVAVKFAVRAYPFEDSLARTICLLAMRKDTRSDIIEEAKRGLHPYWFKTVNTSVIKNANATIKFPEFSEMIKVLDEIGGKLETSPNSIHNFPPGVYEAALSFLEKILVMEAVQGHQTALIIDEDWQTRVETAIEFDEAVRDIVIGYLNNLSSIASLVAFLNLAFGGLNPAYHRILALCPSNIVASQTHLISDITKRLESNQKEIASSCLGIIATHESVDSATIANLIQTLYSSVENRDSKVADGHIMAIGSVLAKLHLRNRSDTLQGLNDISSGFLEILTTIFQSSKNLPLIDACIYAVSQLSIFGAINSDSFLLQVKDYLSSKKENEKAVSALGYISLCDTGDISWYLEKLIQLTSSKHSEYMFSSGESLSIVAAGWNSKVLKRSLDIQGVDISRLPRSNYSDEFLNTVITKVLECTKSTKPGLRKFSCIWLLSMIQYTGHLSATKEKLELIHIAFMRFLSDQDDLVQESASRGLSMVYEMGNAKLKELLVRSLVHSFTSDSKYGVNSGTVSEDTQLFEPGVLNTGDGSVSTYKDILNLASELGDPGLIYQFMSLAAHGALWASRKGAAFGLGSILSKANLDEMVDYKKLVPKLYRYKFDSNPSVQQAMQGIWDSLIKDKSAVINDNFEAILEELLKGMGEKEWRVRQASATALSDLLQGKPLEAYQDRLEQIWQMSFRTLDDIKESVRNAGLILTRSLANNLVRHVEVTTSKRAEEILKNLIPFLMGHQGLQSDAEDVQTFALNTIIKLCKKGSGNALRPFIPDLIEELLVLMSVLEPQAMNYLALNADKYGLTNNAIDASRLASVGRSPIMEAIEKLVDLTTDDKTMEALIPKISSAIKKSVGLPSKVAGSRLLVTMAIRHLRFIIPYADSLLSISISQLGDRNDTVWKSYATASGYLSRVATDSAVLKYAKKLRNLYFSGEEREKLISGYSANAVSKHASDKFNNLASAFLPFIFIGKHDTEKQVQEEFEIAWSDNTGGSGAVKLYLKEILEIANEYLGSQSWGTRQVVSLSVSDASDIVGATLTVKEEFDKLIETLFVAVSGRSWVGKEKVFQSLVQLMISSKFQKADSQLLEKINKIAVTEVKRKNREYQTKAIGIFADYVGSFPQRDLFDVLFDATNIYLGDKSDDEDSDVEMEGTESHMKQEKEAMLVLDGVMKSFKSSKSWKQDFSLTPKDSIFVVSSLIEYLLNTLKTDLKWTTKKAVCAHFSSLIQKLPNDITYWSTSSTHMQELWSLIEKECLDRNKDSNHDTVFTEVKKVIESLSTYLNNSGDSEGSKSLKSLIE